MGFRKKTSGLIVIVEGRVQRVLSDNLIGSRHQRFILRVSTGETLLIAHNIDIAPRIEDLEVESEITVKGEYEWNELGGLIHWTHTSEDDQHEPGWILYRGITYD